MRGENDSIPTRGYQLGIPVRQAVFVLALLEFLEMRLQTANWLGGKMSARYERLADDLWSPSEDEILKKRVEEGVTYALIACELQRQRGSCAARAKRLGLIHPNRDRRRYVTPASKSRAPLNLFPEEQAPDSQFKPFVVLAAHECRYPHGEDPGSFLFCAAPIAQGPYCKFHHNLTHSKILYNPNYDRLMLTVR